MYPHEDPTSQKICKQHEKSCFLFKISISRMVKRDKKRQDYGKEKERMEKILDNKFKKLKEISYSLSDGKQISHSCNKKICERSSFVCLYGEGAICNVFQRREGASWKPALSFLSSLQKNNVFGRSARDLLNSALEIKKVFIQFFFFQKQFRTN